MTFKNTKNIHHSARNNGENNYSLMVSIASKMEQRFSFMLQRRVAPGSSARDVK
jgi:hypothetical protein